MYGEAGSHASHGGRHEEGPPPSGPTGGVSGGLRVRLLGGLAVDCEGRVALDGSFRHGKAKALVKLLALHPDRRLHREQVLAILWDHLTPKAAAANLRKQLHYLRAALRECDATDLIISSRDSLSLTPDAMLDVDEFRALAARARERRTDASLYERALAAYTGDLLPDDRYEDWASDARDELSGLRVTLLEELARLHEVTGRLDGARACLDELVRISPLDEERQRWLARLLAQQGDRQGALRQLDQAREVLREELDVPPEDETEALARAIAQNGHLTPHTGLGTPAGAFVGRDRELAELRAAMDGAIAGRTRVALIEGDPGVGKTRLTEEVATYARIHGATVAWGSCHEDGTSAAYWPWAQIAKSCSSGVAGPGFEAFDGTEARAAAIVEDAEGELARLRLFDQFSSFIRGVTAQRPALFIIEDVHWADAATLALLQFLARTVRDARVLIVVTYRSSEVGRNEQLHALVPQLIELPIVSRFSLEGLSEPESGTYIQSAIGEQPSPALLANVYAQTAGNPFFITQLLRWYQAQGIDLSQAGATKLPVPDTLRHVIGQRLERLSAECRTVLTVAAVVGREFQLGLLEETAERSAGQVLAAVEEACDTGFLVEVEGAVGAFSFAHALVRETLYDGMPLSQRVAHHRQVGEALERRHATGQSRHIEELAHHFYQAMPAGAATKAYSYARQAGDHALSLAAYEEAAGHYSRALESLDYAGAGNERERCAALLALGRAQASLEVPSDALPTLEQAVDLATRLGDPELGGEAAYAYSVAVGRSPFVGTGAAVPILEQAIERMGPGSSGLKARLLTERSLALSEGAHGGGNTDRRVEVARQAADTASEAGDRAAEAEALDALYSASYSPARAEERLSVASEQLRAAQASGLKVQLLWARVNLMSAFLELGRLHEADRDLSTIWSLADLARVPALMHLRPMWSASRALLKGQYAEAERFVAELQSIVERTQEPRVLEVLGAQLFDLRRGQNRLAELEPLIRPIVEERADVTHWLAGLAFIYLETNRKPEAQRWFDQLALGGFADIPQDSRFMVTLAVSAEVACGLDDVGRAALLYDLLAPHGRLNVVIGPALLSFGSAWRPLGQLATTLERWDDAERHFEDALAFHAMIDAPPWLARTQRDLAAMLRKRGRPGDRAKAEQLAQRAQATFHELGMPADKNRTLELYASSRHA